MFQSLHGKVVLITGASGGIGEAAARAFSKAGALVALASRSKEKLTELSLKLENSIVVPTDLSDEHQAIQMVERVFEHFGRIDILINCAASIIVAPIIEVTSEDLYKAFRTNVIAPLVAIRQCIHYMKISGGGVIINIGSPGFMMGIPYYAPYVCSKAAFSALTRTLQSELNMPGIQVCEYFPGYIKTPNRPESLIGPVDQDFLMDKKQNFVTRMFTRPQSPDTVALHLVRLALHPKVLTYSSFSVRMGAQLALFSNFRLRLASNMAAHARETIKNMNQNK